MGLVAWPTAIALTSAVHSRSHPGIMANNRVLDPSRPGGDEEPPLSLEAHLQQIREETSSHDASLSRQPPSFLHVDQAPHFPPAMAQALEAFDANQRCEPIFNHLECLETLLLFSVARLSSSEREQSLPTTTTSDFSVTLGFDDDGSLHDAEEGDDEDVLALETPAVDETIARGKLLSWIRDQQARQTDVSSSPNEHARRAVKVASEREIPRLARVVELRRLLEIRRESLTAHDRELCAEWEKVRADLVIANVRLALKFAYQYRFFVDVAEAFSAALVGLALAVDRFESERGFRFSTYASHWLRQCVTRTVADFGRALRLPVHRLEMVGKARRALSGRSANENLSTTPETIAELSGLTIAEAKRAQQFVRRQRFGDVPDFAHSDTLLDAAYDEQRLSPAAWSPVGVNDGAIPHGERAILAQVVSLGAVERPSRARAAMQEIVLARIGLGLPTSDTLETIGQRRGVTRERIRQVESLAFDLLTRNLPEPGEDDD